MAPTVRAFVALKLKPELAEALAELQRNLQWRLPPDAVRWTRVDQIHLTLRFLGQVEPTSLNSLQGVLEAACAGMPALRLRLERFGGFPTLAQPRVFWVGVGGDLCNLQLLQQRVEAATRDFGDHLEQRAFHAHLTFGRVATRYLATARSLGAALDGFPSPSLGDWEASAVHLVRSHLAAAGATYTDLALFSLGEAAAVRHAG